MTLEERNQLREEYKTIASFMGYEHFPFSNNGTIQNKEYPGWFKPVKLSNDMGEFRLYVYKSPCFVARKTLDLDFKHNWEMLMKVVGKIEKIQHQKYGRFKVKIEDDSCLIQSTLKGKESTYSKVYVSPNNKKQAVYESCLMFVEWYNSNIR